MSHKHFRDPEAMDVTVVSESRDDPKDATWHPNEEEIE